MGAPLLEALFPRRCAGCGAAGADLCSACVLEITGSAPPCPPSPAGVHEAASAGHHEGPLREAILAYKFHRRAALYRLLGELLAAELNRRAPGWQPELLVPIPLHPLRLVQRGYNQSLLVAQVCGARHAVPVRCSLRRTRFSTPQARRDAVSRRSSQRGAFACVRPDEVAGRRVVLVDDVLTTGSTMEAAAAALKAAGALRIFSLTLSYEPLWSDA